MMYSIPPVICGCLPFPPVNPENSQIIDAV